MCRTMLVAWGLWAAALGGCQWAITPDGSGEPLAAAPGSDADDPRQPSLRRPAGRRPALVELNSAGPACTADRGDECPMVEGRCYVMVYAYRGQRMRAYGLRQMLIDRGLDVVVGCQPGHGLYFVRSRRGYDCSDPADCRTVQSLVGVATAALADIRLKHPSILETSVRDMAPEPFYARRP